MVYRGKGQRYDDSDESSPCGCRRKNRSSEKEEEFKESLDPKSRKKALRAPKKLKARSVSGNGEGEGQKMGSRGNDKKSDRDGSRRGRDYESESESLLSDSDSESESLLSESDSESESHHFESESESESHHSDDDSDDPEESHQSDRGGGRKKSLSSRTITEEEIQELTEKALKMAYRTAKELKSQSVPVYSNDSNPFGDPNLNEIFVWRKKIERDVARGVPPEEFSFKAEKQRQKERMAEIEKLRKRREERELEKSRHEVYDVSPFKDDHPRGNEVLLSSTGKDAKNDFEDVGCGNLARERMEKDYIGGIDASTVPAKRTYVRPKTPYNSNKTLEFVIKMGQFLVPVLILGLAVVVPLYTKKE